ncbi:hypothetical protein AGABI2DRAFT_176335 [Agaricus bisporus var. bisporus H97]|uniref:hypothetical protein n=1 Tax=Agaricus bisporus var. bisporus (strain H97 / ATCC MYA-4626 / FGSC 10389) TaxID=936046 RepID=UPI00029F8058|nr:hypothetical protein AGABI2DRAFT_176335 [Agaricus bisporus var. bisporus H97]EKV49667.1 hypothetical protein AGABI2DRAFT_176335 [Agaricus bisporus var. bisporus H97]
MYVEFAEGTKDVVKIGLGEEGVPKVPQARQEATLDLRVANLVLQYPLAYPPSCTFDSWVWAAEELYVDIERASAEALLSQIVTIFVVPGSQTKHRYSPVHSTPLHPRTSPEIMAIPLKIVLSLVAFRDFPALVFRSIPIYMPDVDDP